MKRITQTLLFLALFGSAQAQTFVKTGASGSNNGTSWTNAYSDLQIALAATQPGSQIWVAAGTYKPGTADTSTFLLDKNIQLYGGFAGTETALNQRDWTANPTILSGDVSGDDVPDDFQTNRSDNVFHVLWMTEAVTNDLVLDGFIIQNGHADGNPADSIDSKNLGGGILSYGDPLVRNCLFQQNFALQSGGGAMVWESAGGAIFSHCQFLSNTADMLANNSGGGGLLFYRCGGNSLVEHCTFSKNENLALGFSLGSGVSKNNTFSDNTSHREYLTAGLGLYSEEPYSNLTFVVDSCIFQNNHANGNGYGGGMTASFWGAACSVGLKNSRFIGNTANIGGGIFNGAYAPASFCNFEVDSCHFENNSSNIFGGGICYYDNGTDNQFLSKNSTFIGNESGYGAGLQSTVQGVNHVESCENSSFSENHASIFGGGYRMDVEREGLELSLVNCLVENNTAAGDGGGIEVNTFTTGASDVYLKNVTVTGNHSTNNAAGVNFWLTNNCPGQILLENCYIANNVNAAGGTVQESGGGFTLINKGTGEAKVRFLSSVIENNTSVGTGGILLYNTRPENSPIRDSIFIENSLVAGNEGMEVG